MLNDFYELLREGLKEKMGCVLFQFPPQFVFSDERLEKILRQVNPLFNNVIEFRHDTWWRTDVKTQLKKNSISFCGVSFPKIKEDNAVINTPLAYYRFHGVPKLFYSEYDESFLRKIIMQFKKNKKVKTAYIYFNNTASLAALHNAKFVQNLVSTN